MALMHPRVFPHDLRKKPKLEGEALVFAALASALGNDWWVFYDRPVPGTRRRVDFVVVNPDRGVVAIEVKGGLVHAHRGWFRQLVRRPGQRKRIDPFGQLKLGFAGICRAAGVAVGSVPVHLAIWFPQMGQGAFVWKPTPHIWTRELIEAAAVDDAIEVAVPPAVSGAQRLALGRVAAVLDCAGVR